MAPESFYTMLAGTAGQSPAGCSTVFFSTTRCAPGRDKEVPVPCIKTVYAVLIKIIHSINNLITVFHV